MTCYEGILGLNRDYDGLHINPAFPASWKNVSATRNFRGNKLNIKYINNGGKTVTLKVDGKAIDGNVVPAFDDNNEHDIEVTIG
jgi:cellobiose phosphorylase